MKKRVMIASIFSGNTLDSMIVKLSVTDLFLVVEKNIRDLTGQDIETKRKTIENLKNNFGEIIKIEFIELDNIYDLYEIAKKTIEIIDQISDSEIIMNISEGRKPLSFGLSFAAYLRKDKVKEIYYLVKETNELLKMPFLNFSVNKTEKEMLSNIKNGLYEIKNLKDKIDKSKSVFYKYLKNLQLNGYISLEDDKIKITSLGKLVTL